MQFSKHVDANRHVKLPTPQISLPMFSLHVCIGRTLDWYFSFFFLLSPPCWHCNSGCTKEFTAHYLACHSLKQWFVYKPSTICSLHYERLRLTVLFLREIYAHEKHIIGMGFYSTWRVSHGRIWLRRAQLCSHWSKQWPSWKPCCRSS